MIENLYQIFMRIDSTTITTVATVVLAIITAIYVYLNFKILKQMERQATCDIQISVKGCEYIGDFFNGNKKHFKLSFEVYNKSSASGSITKPVLVLEFSDKTKGIIESDLEGDLVSGQKTYSSIIYLSGGQMCSKVLIYRMPTNFQFSDFAEFVSKVEKSYIEYKDNLNKEYRKSITITSGDYTN